MTDRLHQETPEYANKTSLATRRAQAMEQATLLNNLKTQVQQWMQSCIETVIKQCMAPGMHVDLKQQNLQMRYQAMDTLFAAREEVSKNCLEQCIKGLEARSRENLNRYANPGLQSATLEDAELATIGWTRFEEIAHRYHAPIASVSAAVRHLAVILGRPLDPGYLQMHVLYECFRRQLSALPCTTAERLVLSTMFLDEMTSKAGMLYSQAEALVTRFMEGRDPLPADFDPKLHETTDVVTANLYKAVAAVAPMFSTIERFSDYSEAARKSLMSLRPHMVLLAMSDAEAFEQDDHAARRLIESLMQRWRGIMDAEDARHKDLAAVIDKLISNGEPDAERCARLLAAGAGTD